MIKCNICRREKCENDFQKNGKTLKSCIGCRDKVKNKRVSEKRVEEDNPQTVTPTIKITNPEVRLNNEPDYMRDHKEQTKKIIHEFHQKSAFSCHKYLSRLIMADIRDTFSPSCDRECSFTNSSSSFLSLK